MSIERKDLTWFGLARKVLVGLDPRSQIARPEYSFAYITGASSTDSRRTESLAENFNAIAPLTYVLIAAWATNQGETNEKDAIEFSTTPFGRAATEVAGRLPGKAQHSGKRRHDARTTAPRL